jgi:hypothetical protein
VGNAYNEPVQVTEQPLGWGPVTDEASGQVYYYNYTTGESSWTNPEEGEAAAAEEPAAEEPAAEEPAAEAGGELPSGWQEVNDEQYGLYYYNYVTGDTSYEWPAVPSYPEPAAEGEAALPEGWQEVEDETYGKYYWNSVTGDTSYEWPAA